MDLVKELKLKDHVKCNASRDCESAKLVNEKLL